MINTSEGFEYALTVSESNEGATRLSQLRLPLISRKKGRPGENETEEDKKKLDEEWAAAQQALKDKLANEQKFTKYAYRVSSYWYGGFRPKKTLRIDQRCGGRCYYATVRGICQFHFRILQLRNRIPILFARLRDEEQLTQALTGGTLRERGAPFMGKVTKIMLILNIRTRGRDIFRHGNQGRSENCRGS